MKSRIAARADVLSAVVVLASWIIGAEVWHPQWLPTPFSVLRELWALIVSGSFAALGTTATTLVVSLAITFTASAVVAALMAASEIIEQSLLPFVNGFLAVPHIALIPMFTFIWGNGETTRIVTTVSFAISPVILTWSAALKATTPELTEMATSFGAGPVTRTRYVRLPLAAAPLIAGLRIGVVQGIKGVVSAEVIIGVVGTGQLVTTASNTFNIAQLYAIVMVIIVVSVLAYILLNSIENRMTRWNP